VTGAASATAPISVGKGFSADLAKDLEAPGSGRTKVAQVAEPQVAPPARPAAEAPKPGTPAASEAAKADEAKTGDAAKPGDAAKLGGATASDAVKADEAKTGDAAKPSEARTGDAPRPADTATVAVRALPAASPEPMPARSPAPRGPVKVPGDLAAIKLSLLPNWDRDIGEPGTFQYVVRIKGTQNTKTFSFRYGYDDPKAPIDRDEYKKYLQQASILTGEIKDRQRGSAWLLEGSDPSGLPAFRYVVLYGGKRLICYGSMYRDAESNPLGDDRDQTVIQAKQICESLSL
jgi:hypothetical protein